MLLKCPLNTKNNHVNAKVVRILWASCRPAMDGKVLHLVDLWHNCKMAWLKRRFTFLLYSGAWKVIMRPLLTLIAQKPELPVSDVLSGKPYCRKWSQRWISWPLIKKEWLSLKMTLFLKWKDKYKSIQKESKLHRIDVQIWHHFMVL